MAFGKPPDFQNATVLNDAQLLAILTAILMSGGNQVPGSTGAVGHTEVAISILAYCYSAPIQSLTPTEP